MIAPETRLKELLVGTGLSVSTAESCTGGRISHLITTISGSSEYYIGSVISYSVRIKESVLGVHNSTIENNGVVSASVAKEMAEGVKSVCGTDFSVAITGWADCTGDEHEPAGTAWVAVSGPQGTKCVRITSHSSRKSNISAFSSSALSILVEYIETYLNNSK